MANRKPTTHEPPPGASRLAAVLRDPLPVVIGGLLHDFNNYATLARGRLYVLERELRELRDSARVQRCARQAEQMRAALDRMHRVAGAIHALVRPFYDPSHPLPERTDPADLPAEIRRRFKTADAPATLRFRRFRGLPTLAIPPSIVLFILCELISNAIRAAQGAGMAPHVEIEAAHDAASKLLTFRVRDRGPGFPKHALAQGAWRARTDGGLALSTEIANRLGGDLVVANAPRRGALAIVTLTTECTDG